ncbi:fumarylacetoacetate hydrolase family protein [Parasutterella muris]|uniref:fumarylacetoacetate hydrolase family protein n=1 Tax=Parasutterella muris TaxID=2565572 RepID=UPI00203D75C8|nr:fumarylacetoacetate hydrolase family protein [Parasutterella muris]
MPFLFPQALVPAVPVSGEKDIYFPVHRVYCVGANYADHVAEVGSEGREKPFFFSKPADALVVCREGKEVEIPYARDTDNLCLEVELVVAIGKTAPKFGKITPEEAEKYIFGYAAGVEFTRRNWQKYVRENRQPWEKAKGFDYSALVTEIKDKRRMPDPDNLSIWLYVDNQERQRGNTDRMIWKIPEIISELSESWRLTAGDLIYTGTPAGSGPIKEGQSFEGGINGAGTFKAKMVAP